MGAELIFIITTFYEKILCEKHFLLMALAYELSFHFSHFIGNKSPSTTRKCASRKTSRTRAVRLAFIIPISIQHLVP